MTCSRPTVEPLFGEDDSSEAMTIAAALGPVAAVGAGAVANAVTEVEVEAKYLVQDAP